MFQCLELLGLTEFLALIRESDFINQTDFGQTSSTLFAPTNAAIEAVRDELDQMDSTMIVGNHVVGRALKEDDLIFNQRFQTIVNLTIHSTEVVFGDRTLLQYSPGYWRKSNSYQSHGIRYSFVSSNILALFIPACKPVWLLYINECY